jgi:hypothetical protein
MRCQEFTDHTDGVRGSLALWNTGSVVTALLKLSITRQAPPYAS